MCVLGGDLFSGCCFPFLSFFLFPSLPLLFLLFSPFFRIKGFPSSPFLHLRCREERMRQWSLLSYQLWDFVGRRNHHWEPFYSSHSSLFEVTFSLVKNWIGKGVELVYFRPKLLSNISGMFKAMISWVEILFVFLKQERTVKLHFNTNSGRRCKTSFSLNISFANARRNKLSERWSLKV